MSRYLDRIIDRFKSQRKKGLDKYGQVLENNHAPMLERIEHLAQELTGRTYVYRVDKGARNIHKGHAHHRSLRSNHIHTDSAQVEIDRTSLVRRNPDRTIRERL